MEIVTKHLCDVCHLQVLAAARHGFQSHGVELNWWLVMYSRLTAVRSGLKGRATFARQDLWKSNLAPYGNVVIFGVEEMVSVLHLTQALF